MTYTIYELKCSASDKRYVGMTKDFAARQRNHMWTVKSGHKNPNVRKLSEDNPDGVWTASPLHVVESRHLAERVERQTVVADHIAGRSLNVMFAHGEDGTLGSRLRVLRLLVGWTPTDLADAAKCCVRSIHLYELSKRTPSIAALQRLAHALDVDIAELASLKVPKPGAA